MSCIRKTRDKETREHKYSTFPEVLGVPRALVIQLVPGTTCQTMALSSNEEDTTGCSGPVHWDDPEG